MACLRRRFFRNCCCYWGRTHSDFFPPKNVPAGATACCPVDGLNRISVTRFQLRVLRPESRAVRVLFSCTESRAGNFCPVFTNEMNSAYFVYLSFVGAACRVHGLCYTIVRQTRNRGYVLAVFLDFERAFDMKSGGRA
jgi:hypothetical protein